MSLNLLFVLILFGCLDFSDLSDWFCYSLLLLFCECGDCTASIRFGSFVWVFWCDFGLGFDCWLVVFGGAVIVVLRLRLCLGFG